jgi:hypothetical protein
VEIAAARSAAAAAQVAPRMGRPAKAQLGCDGRKPQRLAGARNVQDSARPSRSRRATRVGGDDVVGSESRRPVTTTIVTRRASWCKRAAFTAFVVAADREDARLVACQLAGALLGVRRDQDARSLSFGREWPGVGILGSGSSGCVGQVLSATRRSPSSTR